MKKSIVLICLLFILIMTACSQKPEAEETSSNISSLKPSTNISQESPSSVRSENDKDSSVPEYNEADKSKMTMLDLEFSLTEETPEYRYYTRNNYSQTYYEIINEKDDVIDAGVWEGPIRFENENGILKVIKGAGTFVNLTRYYDLTNSKISKWYNTPLTVGGEYVALQEVSSVVIQEIFTDGGYKKVVPLEISSATPFPAEFINNNTQLKITYPTEPNDKQVTLVIDLD